MWSGLEGVLRFVKGTNRLNLCYRGAAAPWCEGGREAVEQGRG